MRPMAGDYWREKVCVVTGGSAGLGLEIARAASLRRGRVVLVARQADRLEAAAAQLRAAGGHADAIVADVSRQADVERLAATVAQRYGGVDLLCNCAGRSARGAVLDATPEDFHELLDVNLIAAVRVTRALAPLVLPRRGHLVNIASLACKVAPRFMGAYPASKFALAAYTQQLRLELGPQGLHVLLVCPGPIARDGAPRYADAAGVPEEAQGPGAGARLHALEPRQLAEDILDACQRRKLELVRPAKARLLFVLGQISARWGDWLLSRSMRSKDH